MPKKITDAPKRATPANIVLDRMQLTLYVPSKMTDGAGEKALDLLDNADFLYEVELAIRAVFLTHKETALVTVSAWR